MSLKLNMQEIKRLNNAAVRAMEQTVDALQTEIRTAQVMPYDNGDMQNNDTFTETSVHDHDIESRLITGSVQARRLYNHPEYNFQTVNNPKIDRRQVAGTVDQWRKKGFRTDDI